MAEKIKILLQAADQTKAAFKSVSRSMSKLDKASAALGVSLGPIAAFASAGAIVAIGKQSLKAADEIQKMSKRLEISTEALSQYRHVADLSGTDFEALAKGIAKSQRTIADAEDGLSTATRAIEDMGLTVAELKGLKPEDAFEKMGAAMAAIVDPYTRASVAANVFGRAGKELIPIFSDGAASVRAMRDEADRLGLTLSQDMADKAAEAEDAMTRLKASFTGAANELTLKFAPALTAVGNQLSIAFSDDKVSSLMQQLEKDDPAFHAHLRRMSVAVGGLSDDWIRAALAAHQAGETFSMVQMPGMAGGGLGVPDTSFAPPVADMIGPVKDYTIAWTELDEVMYNADRANAILEFSERWRAAINANAAAMDNAGAATVGLETQASETYDLLAKEGEFAANTFGDAIVDAALRGGDAISAMGDIAMSVFSSIVSGFISLGISSLFTGGIGAAATPFGNGPGLLPLSMASGGATGAATSSTTINSMTINATSTLNTDPMSVRRLAEQIQGELDEVARHRG